MKRILVVLTLTTLVSASWAQMARGDFNQKFLEANQLMEEKLWNKSVDLWTDLYQANNTNANLNYKLGYCYLQTANEKLKSMSFLKAAATIGVSERYDPYDPAEVNAPLEALYYLGRAQHLNYEMNEAIASYNDLLTKVTDKHRLFFDAQRQIEMCNEAIHQVNNPKNYLVNNVGNVVNNEFNDYSPVVSLDESALFFTSRRIRPDSSNTDITDFDTGENKEDIYVSYKDMEGSWMDPELLNINTDEHAASISVSPDGQTLYIYYDEGGNGQIYSSVLIGETWSSPELLGSDINTPAWETHATVSADGRILYFVSNREGGYGGRDIYRCVKLPNDEWSKALNIGSGINTEYEEDAVFLSADGKTLYFASTGHNSMGGFDIFFSEIGSDGEWGKPENIGYPLNTVDDDVFFYPTADQKRAYYSSRKEEGFGLKDIYVIDMPDAPVETDLAVLKGYVIAPEGEELPGDMYVLVTNNKTGEVTQYRPRSRDGAYVAILPPCIAYHIEYVIDKEIVHEEFINVPCESAYSVIDKEIHLLPIYLDGEMTSMDVKVVDVRDDLKDKGDGKPDVVVDIPDTGYDPENPINVDVNVADAYFERFFVYDYHEFGEGEQKFKQFLDGVEQMIKVKGPVNILVESSASNVPSSRFENNQELTGWRNKTASDQITNALTKAGYNKNTDFFFTSPKELVQGPEYANDAVKRQKYEPFQYIKVWAEIR